MKKCGILPTERRWNIWKGNWNKKDSTKFQGDTWEGRNVEDIKADDFSDIMKDRLLRFKEQAELKKGNWYLGNTTVIV